MQDNHAFFSLLLFSQMERKNTFTIQDHRYIGNHLAYVTVVPLSYATSKIVR